MAANTTVFFTRMGKLFGMAAAVRTHQANLETKLSGILGEYSGNDIQYLSSLVDNINRRIEDAGRVVSDIHRAATQTLIETFDEDLISTQGGGLENKTIPDAIKELIRQMQAAGTPVTTNKNTESVGSASAASGNVGNGKFLMTALASLSETTSAYAFNYPSIKKETIRALCVTDATGGQTTENGEAFRITGQRADPNLGFEWPKGSGINQIIAVASPRVHNGRKPGVNICRNSDFEAFTSNAPDHWEVNTGIAGSDIEESTTAHTQDKALKFTGNGSTLIALKQVLNSASGTLGQVRPNRAFTISFAVRRDGTSPSAGALRIAVKAPDGSTFNDGSVGRDMGIDLAHGSITTSYVVHTIVCQSPLSIPKGSYITIQTSTAFTSGTEILIDDLVIAECHQPMAGGVSFQIIGGSTPFAFDDEFTIAVANSYDGKFVVEFDRFFDMQRLGLVLPSVASGETINDNLIS
jgi:hypothetical protein